MKSAGNAFENAMRHGEEEQLRRKIELEEQRVASARDAINRLVLRLKEAIRRVGSREEDGHVHVRFGVLFEATANEIAALSGILKTARRLGVVSYDGEVTVLFQGQHDGVDVVLLDESDATEWDIQVHDKGTHGAEEERNPFAMDEKIHQGQACYICGDPIYPIDRIGVSNVSMHKRCFVCQKEGCSQVLTAARYGSLEQNGKMRFYCVPHFEANFKLNADYSKGFSTK